MNSLNQPESKLVSANLLKFYSDRHDFQNWFLFTDLTHWLLPAIDRSGALVPPYRISCCERNALPNINDNIISFQECMHRRAEEIYLRHRETGKPIVLAYSGGIDSTAVLAALIETMGLSECRRILLIAATQDSIAENNALWYNTILPNFDLIPATELESYINDRHILVIGDPGSGNFTGNVPANSQDLFEQPAQIDHMQYLHSRGILRVSNKNRVLYSAIKQSSEHYGLRLYTLKEFSWWFYFNFKWQTVDPRWAYRVSAKPRHYWFNDVYVFYNTLYFQSWSMHQGRYLPSLKPVQKDFIGKTFADLHYVNSKGKFFSASRLFRGCRYHDALDLDYQPVSITDPELYYNPDNSYLNL